MMRFRVGADEADGQVFAPGAGPGGGDHRLRHVDADAVAPTVGQPRNRKRRRAGPAADVEHVRPGSSPDGVRDEILERPEQVVEQLLRPDPGPPGLAFPTFGVAAGGPIRALHPVSDPGGRLAPGDSGTRPQRARSNGSLPPRAHLPLRGRTIRNSPAQCIMLIR